MIDLFADERRVEPLDEGALLLRGFALDEDAALLGGVGAIATAAPFRIMRTPGGRAMSAAMTNCGGWGWTSSAGGYAYRDVDPESGARWPIMPAVFRDLAIRASRVAGFADYDPDGCLINRYGPAARMGLHQDRDEADLGQPIVSVSLGLTTTFLWGGPRRNDRPRRLRLDHGDVLVWGGASRMTFHGVEPPEPGDHPLAGPWRYNLTFRRAR